MNIFTQVLLSAGVSIGFALLIWLLMTLYKWAKKRKPAAIGLGMMMHVFMPVPNAEKSIVQVIEKKQIEEKKSAQTKNGLKEH